MSLALGVLRWSPDVVWRATPRELAAALGGLRGSGPEPAGRATLASLMADFPDL